MPGIRSEVLAYLSAVCSGMIVVCGYSCVRTLRRVIRHSMWAVTIEDLLYWAVVSIYLFVQIYRVSDGNIRWFFVPGTALGGIFFWLLERQVTAVVENCTKNRYDFMKKY